MRYEKTRSGHHELDSLTLAQLLRSRRGSEGLSLTRMAAKLGISRPYLSRLESGQQTHPSGVTLARLSKGLRVSPDDLYALTGSLPPSDLPSFAPYLRAKHPDWPELVITELDDFRGYLKHKYSLR